MKIVHLVSTFPPYRGGMGDACYDQVQELARLGHNITVLTPFYRQIIRSQQNSVTIKYLKPFLQFGNAAFVPQITKFIKNFDIIHLHWPFIGGAETLLFWCLIHLKKRPKLVIQYQMDLVGHGLLGLIFKIYQASFLPLVVRLADRVIVSSLNYAKNSKLKKYLSVYPNKFIEIPMGVDLKMFYPREKDTLLLRKYNLEHEDQIILFVGGLDRPHYFKGVDILLSAFQKLIQQNRKSAKLFIIGDGELKLSYINLAQKLGVRDHVHFVSSVNQNELADYYNLADIFVLPSINNAESFGLVTLYAMACAKPVIVSDLPGPKTLVQDGVSGFLFEPKKIDQLVVKIKYFLDNIAEERTFGSAGRKLAEEKYSWQIISQRINQLYLDLS